jgi:hypothetical protein
MKKVFLTACTAVKVYFGGLENMIVTVILSGGSGSRLWPLSREMYPK